MTTAEIEKLKRYLRERGANPGQLEHNDFRRLISRSVSRRELEEVKDLVRVAFGRVTIETPDVEDAPLLTWRPVT